MSLKLEQLSLTFLSGVFNSAFSDKEAADVISSGDHSVCIINSRRGQWQVLLDVDNMPITFQTRVKLKPLPREVISQLEKTLNYGNTSSKTL